MKPAQLSHDLREILRGFPKPVRAEAGIMIQRTQQVFGKPHLHSGLGLRRLIKDYYEVRVGLKLRLIFKNEKEVLSFLFIGNHDQVQTFFKRI